MLKKKVSSEPTISEVKTTVVIHNIGKIEPFGNEDMHKLVAKLNEIIEHINGKN